MKKTFISLCTATFLFALFLAPVHPASAVTLEGLRKQVQELRAKIDALMRVRFARINRTAASKQLTPRLFEGFETVKVSKSRSRLPQGETEIVADNNGRIAVVWMDGSPANLRLTLRAAYSGDGGRTFSDDFAIAGNLRLGDPALDMDAGGNLYLSALRKDSLRWVDVATILFRSFDFGKSWQAPVLVNDDNIFNDRDWINVDDRGGVHIVRSPRIPQPSGAYQRNVYYDYSADGGTTFSKSVLVNSVPMPNANGGGARGIGVAPGGKIYVALQTSPIENADVRGAALGERGYLYEKPAGQDAFSGPYEFTTGGVFIAGGTDEYLQTPEAGFQPNPRMKIYADQSGKTTAYVVWIGDPKDGTHGVYLGRYPPGQSSFDTPRLIASGPSRAFRLPILAVDPKGRLHVFWIQNMAPGENRWALAHSKSADGGNTFSVPRQISPIVFPIEQWPGDFMGATANDEYVFVAWAVAGGPEKGIYVSRAALSAGRESPSNAMRK